MIRVPNLMEKSFRLQTVRTGISIPVRKGEDKMERIALALRGKIMSAEQAAQLIQTGMTIGMSGFTSVGYPKAIPRALVQSRHAKDLTVLIGASTGDDLDGAMTRAGIVKKRFSYQSNKDMRNAINSGTIGYSDMHVSQFPLYVNQGVGPSIDIAVVECSSVSDQGLVPSASVGCIDAIVRSASKVILEVNETLPLELYGMHDIFDIGVPPNAKFPEISEPLSRIGTPFVPCPPEKIAAIVVTQLEDQPAKFKPLTPVSQQIGENVVEFLKKEIAAGRLPKKLGPIQSGVGSVGNSVLKSLTSSGFRGLNMYTEVMQDAALSLLEEGIFDSVSASSLSLEAETRKYFYENIHKFSGKIVLRPQEISNHPAVIRRLGVIAINTPIELDIYGNVNSTHIMGTQIMNGIGGSGDFTRNARLNIFATESVAKGGIISCIVPMVPHVDHTEHDVQVIITEQGIADLRWKTPLERAKLLIENCAHPDYRPLLRDYLRHARKVSKGQHTPHDLATALSWHQRYLDTGSMRA